MAVTAAQVSELRKITGAGMMDCKKALTETNGDLDAAVEHMRKTGLAKANKKASRVAAEGVISCEFSDDGKQAVIVEINCETDFVARDDNFVQFVGVVTKVALTQQCASAEELLKADSGVDGQDIETLRTALIAKIGENITVRRVQQFQTSDNLSYYKHGSKIGVLVEYKGADDNLGKDIAMHIAASSPIVVNASDVPATLVDKEREIFLAQAIESGKPEEIAQKMVEGRVNKYLKEVSLLGQSYVKDPSMNVEAYLKSNDASVTQFVRFEVGEGIEKKTVDFAAEVAEQLKGK